MSAITFILLGLIFGLCNTCVLHLAKAMERHGIEIFSRDKTLKEKGKKPLIYIVGLVLNNMVFIWQFLGLTFSSAAVFSSVFGVGLVVLMLYSYFILHEEISRPELIGAILIIIGTTMVGVLYIIEPPVQENLIYNNFFTLLIIIALISLVLITISVKAGIGVAFIFGAIAGTFGGMD
ncbi:MAG: hypothetical protein EU544_05285, partial [Promethearchaeota archaeon]